MYQKIPSDKNQKMPCGPDYYEAIKELTEINYARNMRVEAMLVQKWMRGKELEAASTDNILNILIREAEIGYQLEMGT